MTVRGRPRFSTIKVRKFENLKLKRTYHFALKEQAVNYAEKVRKQNRHARIVKHAGAWTVYTD